MALSFPFAALYAYYLPDIPERSQAGDMRHVRLRCPFHEDSNASAVIYYDTGIFSCPVCNSLSITNFISKIVGCSYKEADIIVSEFFANTEGFKQDDSYFSKSPKRKPSWDALVKEAQNNLSPDLPIVKEYLNRKNLKYETLVKAGIGFLPADKTNWKQDSLVFPYYIQGHVWGIRYRNMDMQKYGESDTTFTLWGLETIPAFCNAVIIVEGETDRLTIMEMFPDIPVVSTPTCKFKKEWRREFNDISTIICIPQSDEASENLTKNLSNIFKDDITIVELPWKRSQLGKDINDWANQNDVTEFKLHIESIVASSENLCITGSELSNEEEEKEFYINGLLSPNQICSIVGPMKAKKTFTMFNMIRTLLLDDVPFLGLPDTIRGLDPGHIIIIEEEGTKKDLSDRAKLILAGTGWRDKTTWIHKKGFQLDNPKWINKLASIIKEKEAGIVCLDCFSKMHTKNEDLAKEMAPIWSNVRSLLHRFPKLTFIIIHHFGKRGEIAQGWEAIRGSSTYGAEMDLAIFQEKKETKDGETIRIKIDGREIDSIVDSEGNDILKCTHYGDGSINLSYKTKTLLITKEKFYEEIDQRKSWGLKECSAELNRDPSTIRRWVELSDGKYYITRPSAGNPATVMCK